VTEAEKPINCRAEGLDIGSGTYVAKDGDSIELSPVLIVAARPYVLNIQRPSWFVRALIGFIAALGVVLALLLGERTIRGRYVAGSMNRG
jgi:hypothetical protein